MAGLSNDNSAYRCSANNELALYRYKTLRWSKHQRNHTFAMQQLPLPLAPHASQEAGLARFRGEIEPRKLTNIGQHFLWKVKVAKREPGTLRLNISELFQMDLVHSGCETLTVDLRRSDPMTREAHICNVQYDYLVMTVAGNVRLRQASPLSYAMGCSINCPKTGLNLTSDTKKPPLVRQLGLEIMG
ncbi:hypothetical protein ANN_03001 [Periplaneta americana]|uniref:Uncharacterized protein n=1 Tax=Periplaneta americana TaxID=6978 RepID=A0ABQ8TZH3_PERAM|nr:hypothetical protein ANN_03001 [Periplaneta americana]